MLSTQRTRILVAGGAAFAAELFSFGCAARGRQLFDPCADTQEQATVCKAAIPSNSYLSPQELLENVETQLLKPNANFESVLKGISQAGKKDLGNHLSFLIEKSIPHNRAEHVSLHRRIALLRNLSAGSIDRHIEEIGERSLQTLFEGMGAWNGGSYPIDYLHFSITTIHRVYPFLTSQQQNRCLLVLEQLRSQFLSLPQEIIVGRLTAAQRIQETDIRTMRERFETAFEEKCSEGTTPQSVHELRTALIQDTRWKLIGKKWSLDASELSTEHASWKLEFLFHREIMECVLRSECDPLVAISLPFPDFLKRVCRGDSLKIVTQALESRAQEMESGRTAHFRRLNFPMNQKIGYIPLIHCDATSHADMGRRGMLSSFYLAAALRHAFPHTELWPIHLSSDPQRELTVAFAHLYRRGTGAQTFIIDPYAHGSFDGFEFERPFAIEAIVLLAKAYPDCTFVVLCSSCFTAWTIPGVQEEARRNPDSLNNRDCFGWCAS